MKKLLVLIFSLFFLSSPSVFADDISDFQIEGISIGDSLLDYMTEDEILKEMELSKNDYYYLNEPSKYSEIYKRKNLQTFDVLAFIVKNTPTNEYITNKNNKYTILSIRGITIYADDLDGCLQKRDGIVEELSKMFPYAQKTEDSYVFDLDQTFTDEVSFILDSGNQVEISCIDYTETISIKNNWDDNLSVAIDSKEIISWLGDY